MKKKDHQVEMRYEKKWIYNKNNYYQILILNIIIKIEL